MKKQFRFVLSDNYSDLDGGRESLDLLIGRMRPLEDSGASITIAEHPSNSTTPKHLELVKQIRSALSVGWAGAHHDESLAVPNSMTIVFEF